MTSGSLAEIIAAQEATAEAEWLAGWLTGPTRTRWTELPVQVSDQAPDLDLADSNGERRQLSDAWASGPVLLVFLRHFGCSCLRDRWDRLTTEIEAYRAAGATVQLVCQGEPERTADVAARRGYPTPVWCDPDRRAYQAYGLLQGTPPQLLHDFAWHPGDEALAEAVGRTARRGTERALVDDPWQLPGEFVVAADGRIALAHRYQYCEDLPAAGVLLGAIATALG
ncbi:MAG: AhpC/TSA family protein [Candidatus Limnocylindrales bacterium]